MFDIGFSELVVVGVVALIVIGPERLPKVARTAGHLLGRFQRYAASVKSDISREMQMDELRKAGQSFKESVESAASGVAAQANVVDDYLKNEIGQIDQAVTTRVATEEANPVTGHAARLTGESAAPVERIPHPQQSFDLDTRPASVVESASQPDSGKPPAA
ncbi:MAG: Sec-independent protein translocase protein TatB [Thiobacillaceae bacterium]